MSRLLIISDLILPVVIFSILLYGYTKKVAVYDVFIKGAAQGIQTVFDILPTLIGLMVSVSVLRACGALDILVYLIRPITNLFDFPAEVIPLCLMRLVSSSAATGMLTDLFALYGPDSFIGRLSSVIMSCTETVFYTLSVYFMRVRIKSTGYALPASLLANAAGIVAAYFITVLMFGK